MSNKPIIHTASNEYTEGEQTTFVAEIKRLNERITELEAALRAILEINEAIDPHNPDEWEPPFYVAQDIARKALGEGE